MSPYEVRARTYHGDVHHRTFDDREEAVEEMLLHNGIEDDIGDEVAYYVREISEADEADRQQKVRDALTTLRGGS